jgi:hypothetical protein
MKKRLSFIFLSAFALNLAWENLHAQLYAGYQGGQITAWILVRATFWDAVIVTALCALALLLPRRGRPWFVLGGGLAASIGMEKWALATYRWAYASDMPIVPFVHTGLTPTVQLGLTGIVVFYLFLETLP